MRVCFLVNFSAPPRASGGDMSDSLEPNEPQLRDDLATLFDRTPAVPRAVDDAILNRARAHLLTRAARSRRRRPWVGAAAVAAAACVAIVLWTSAIVQRRARAAALAGDVDRNGRVDIVDAMLLARAVESNQPPRRASEDVNHDGVVDRRDVDAIAMAAVKLPDGSELR
jgi:hypothetical protein